MAPPSPRLPPELEALAQLLDAEAPNVREIFQYALAMLMVEAGKADVVQHVTTDDGREHVQIVTAAGDAFSVVVPAVGEELLIQLMQMAREVVGEDADAGEEP